MASQFYIGLALIMMAGIFSGTFSTPFTRNREWKWENNWLVWSFVALIICPWTMASATVPGLFSLYAENVSSTATIALLGLVWGVGAVLFGLGIDYLGVSLAIPIMQGLINSIGTLVPFWLEHPSEILSQEGLRLISGVAVIVVGIVFFSVAGKARDGGGHGNGRFRIGILICILAGVLGPMINFGFVFGRPLQEAAVAHGTSEVFAANPVWSLLLTTGFITNALQCIWLLRKNGTSRNFSKSGAGAYVWAALAGVLWYLSIMLYGMGCNYLDDNAASAGWAVMQAMSIISGNAAGLCLGEWKGSPKNSFLLIFAGLVCMVLGIIVISYK